MNIKVKIKAKVQEGKLKMTEAKLMMTPAVLIGSVN